MALFNKSDSFNKRVFEKEKVLKDILHILENEFGAYKVIHSKNDPWDLLVIRMVSHTIILKLGAMGLHESSREAIFQEIFAINIMSPDEKIDEEIYKWSHGWTKAHYILSDAQTLKRKLLEVKNG